MIDFPLPGSAPAVVAAPAPGEGPGFWAGAPCAVLDDDGSVLLAYRVRNGHAVKDPIVRRDGDGRWHAWICRHLLDIPGEEDRMNSA